MSSRARIPLVKLFDSSDAIVEYVSNSIELKSTNFMRSIIWVCGPCERRCDEWTTFGSNFRSEEQARTEYPLARGFSFNIVTSDCDNVLANETELAALDLQWEYEKLDCTLFDAKNRSLALDLPLSQHRSFRPIVFVCHDIGECVVEKVRTLPLLRAAPLNVTRLYRRAVLPTDNILSLIELLEWCA